MEHIVQEPEAWLKANRCPSCTRRKQPACVYAVKPRIGGGYRCYGYKSRFWDERAEFGKEGA